MGSAKGEEKYRTDEIEMVKKFTRGLSFLAMCRR